MCIFTAGFTVLLTGIYQKFLVKFKLSRLIIWSTLPVKRTGRLKVFIYFRRAFLTLLRLSFVTKINRSCPNLYALASLISFFRNENLQFLKTLPIDFPSVSQRTMKFHCSDRVKVIKVFISNAFLYIKKIFMKLVIILYNIVKKNQNFSR